MSELIINEKIRSKTIRLIDGDFQGVISTYEGISRARKQNLDLVITADGEPPICKILDADKFRYDKKKNEREFAKQQRAMIIETKEIQLRPVTDEHDIDTKAKHARKFLDDGNRVRIVIKFKGRERHHKDLGREIIELFLSKIGEYKVDKPLTSGDADFIMILSSVLSKSEIVKQKKTY